MPRVINVNEIPRESKNAPVPEYRWSTSDDLGKALHLTDFCCHVKSLETGMFSYPYHFHSDVCEHPDSRKVNILPQQDIFHRGHDADYFDEEKEPGTVWAKLPLDDRAAKEQQ